MNQAITLSQLNQHVRNALKRAISTPVWIQTELTDVRTQGASGHCYLEFVEKHPETGQLLAKARGNIWSNTLRTLKPFFERETGQTFRSGIKVLVCVTVEFHELYGYSLTIINIDPSYTMGDLVRRRQEIIKRIKADGLWDLNRELPFPGLPLRLALITSPTAAGYEDFMDQILHNHADYPFLIKLFPSTMQGDRTEESIIHALGQIFDHQHLFDAVVIIRGGGSTTDLHAFDSYELAAHCAQFPLPILTGIGHERDESILDLVAHSRLKTPTAVAEFLIERMDIQSNQIQELQLRLEQHADRILTTERSRLQTVSTRFPSFALQYLTTQRTIAQRLSAQIQNLVPQKIANSEKRLQHISARLPSVVQSVVSSERGQIDRLQQTLKTSLHNNLEMRRKQLQLDEQFIRLSSPSYLLKRGYTLTTTSDGQIIKSSETVTKGSELTTYFHDGAIHSIVTDKHQNK